MPDRVADPWGRRTPYPAGGNWPTRVDEHLVAGVSADQVRQWVTSACVLCSNGCGLRIGVADGRVVGVRGQAGDRVNRGRLGPKGLYGWQGQQRDRLTTPLVRAEGGELVACDWDTAMNRVVARSRELLDRWGPLSHAFYTSGQLLLEEYYTLSVIGKAGLGTPHMDGNTRLCTATADAALKESFGTDGQPACYADVDHCDTLVLHGHNAAETQTVLWARVLDRLAGPDRPRLVCVDPRRTEVARHADVHLPVRPGTNLALLNGLLREVLHRGWVDHDWVAAHTLGLDELARVVADYPAGRVADICGVSARDVLAAAEVFGTGQRVLSTVLQGVYQSHQATASACQVNNLHLLRGMLGRPGCGVLQMNGQPTAQNTRECGANGDLPGFRNWANPRHVRELAELWDVAEETIPHTGPPTHAMQIFRYAEQGSVRLLWIAGTNPAVSLPDLDRVRRILGGDTVFVVVSDAYLTETAELADVVLPSALWGEKTGTFTNTDRTVHLAEQAVPPPGQARGDLDTWLDYARRMGFRTRSGRPLPWWSTPAEAFAEWQRCSAGRPCDYTGMSYQALRERHGIQWPCTPDRPQGTERLYVDGVFNTDTDYCEDFGHELLTGAARTEQQHRATAPGGRALLRAAHHTEPPHGPNADYPLRLTTGRTVYHFHTRTKTGRAPQLAEAAPAPWVELSDVDARRLGVVEGDVVRLTTPQGSVELPARVVRAEPGTVFVPFHYGQRASESTLDGGRTHAANELVPTGWDPVSKQPVVKVCGVRVRRVGAGTGPAPAPELGAARRVVVGPPGATAAGGDRPCT
ncbi:molybdopterin oxidoreductase family protein [Goodfellowiella coeruleoviolacea]|uniref:molybdopterin oxidoreductase family protein n=1 Tax=Goodfellowiella coeruleoviolacea TaxID=334858 RepID=UPI0020A3B337|nr:nitrate reductase [Goodfellowiella coeruleoviolacea]